MLITEVRDRTHRMGKHTSTIAIVAIAIEIEHALRWSTN